MPGKGKAPSTAQWSRERDQRRRESQFTKVTADGQLRGPNLPDGSWHPRTVAWFETWRRSPMASTFIDADWDFLIDTALLHTEMWSGSPGLAAEIRLRVSKLGVTPEDRLRLKLQIDDEIEQAPKPKRMDAGRRDRLLSIVDG